MSNRKLQALLIATLSILLLSSSGFASSPVEEDSQYDIVFVNAVLVDGTGAPRRKADVAIHLGRIAAIGDLQHKDAAVRMDIDGLVLAPGFIDVHSHADRDAIIPQSRMLQGLITQGVTTAVFGVDGESSLDDIRRSRELFDTQGIGTNYMYYIGHNGTRAAVMGSAARAPDDQELARMSTDVREAMQLGAIGLSTGLMYLPGSHATTDEIVVLAREAAAYGGRYDSHIRDPASNLLQSIDECLRISRAAGLAAHPAHIKAVGAKNFFMSDKIISLIEKAIADGQNVTADVYPYDGAAVRTLEALLIRPGDWDIQQALQDPAKREQIRLNSEQPPADKFSWIAVAGYSSMRVVVSEQPGFEGQMLLDLAEQNQKSPFDLVADTVIAEGANAKITLGAIQEPDVQALLKQPWVMISSDGRDGGFDAGSGHPRSRGTFPRVLGKYVNELHLLTLEEAIRKMTSLPASYLRLSDRGIIREGAVADITIFNPDSITDRSTWAMPSLYSEGVVNVLIGGQFAMRDGQMTGSVNGQFLPYRGTANANQ